MVGKKILVVDDEKDIRDTVKDLLLEAGFRVALAENGKDMLKKLPKEKPDLILLDILMPGMTTLDILSELKKKKNRTPIIFLSVVRFAEHTKSIITDNMIDYIEKPFENKDLIKRVKNALM